MIQGDADEGLRNEEHVHHEFMRLCLHDYIQSRPLRRHAWKLCSSFDFMVPLHSMANIQLGSGYIVVWEVHIVQDARLDDNSARKRIARAEQRGTTVRAEVRCDLVSRICRLGDLLRFAWEWLGIYRGPKNGDLCTGLKLEAVFGDDKIVAKSRTADLSAVKAVA